MGNGTDNPQNYLDIMAAKLWEQNYGGSPTMTGQAASSPANLPAYNSNLSTLYPNNSRMQQQISDNQYAHALGNLSSETNDAMWNRANQLGLRQGLSPTGQGGHTITNSLNRSLLGKTIEGLQSQGLQEYLSTLQGYSGTLMPTTGETMGAETSRYGTDVGAATSRYGVDVGAGTAANALSEQARGTNINAGLQAAQLGIQGANVGANYLNSYLSFLK